MAEARLGPAQYMAAAGEVGALSLVRLNVAQSPPDLVAVYEDWVERLEELNPPSELDEYHGRWLTVVSAMRDAAVELIASPDPAAAFAEYSTQMADLGIELAALAEIETGIINGVLEDNAGDPVSGYFLARAEPQAQVAATVESLFAVLGGLVSDPEDAVRAMLGMFDEFDEVADEWRLLDPPPELEDLHERQLQIWDETIGVFSELSGALESGEPPSPDLIVRLSGLSAEAPFLNAEWTLALAAALRGPDNSGFQGRWHQDESRGDANEYHAELFCTGSSAVVECQYFSRTASYPSAIVAVGSFQGSIVDDTACLSYLEEVCDRALVIAQGVSSSENVGATGNSGPGTLIVGTDGIMVWAWDDPEWFGSEFHCPWFRSYSTALEVDNSCTFAG